MQAPPSRVRVLVFGSYDAAAHPRVGIIMNGLREHGFDVVECNAPLGLDTAARVAMLAQPWRFPVLLARLARCWGRLARAARRLPPPDVVVVGYLGHFDVRLARLLFRGTPIVLDHLIGASDTARDRQLSGGIRQVLLRAIDSGALRSADLIMVDTEEHLAALPSAHQRRAVVVPVGAPRAWFDAAQSHLPDVAAPGRRLRVAFFGLYTPLQGAPVIGEAIALLAGAPIEMTMIGHGQDGPATRHAAANNAVRWVDWVAPDDLPELVAAHDVCLGIFGTGTKALRVVPNKVFQGAAAGCAIVTSGSAPQRRALGDAARFVPPGDPAALADALRRLAGDPAELGRGRAAARRLALDSFTPEQVVRPLIKRLEQLVPDAAGDGAPPRSGTPGARPESPAAWPASSGALDRLAPLTPNAWLRYDLVRRMIPQSVADILEVGCGQGALGVRLAARYRYLGLEPDPKSYAVARHRFAQTGRGEVRGTQVGSLDQAERFDLVCAFEVLEHIKDDAAALAEWARWLRPGGWLLLSVPAYQRRFAAADELVGHFRRYDPAMIVELLRRTGFEEIEVREYGMPLGYLLEAGRNAVARRRLAAAPAESMEQRTGASGRLLQPRGALRGAAARWGTAPFRLAQRGFPRTGTGLVVRARLGAANRGLPAS
jgi:SAM-dependent methyltransferase/glycosyltransferase involved in cell wall biosynthesis